MTDKDWQEILPVPELDEMSSQVESELEADGFKIKNFRTGKIFKTLEMIFLKAVNELYKLLLQVIAMVFITDAKGFWLDMKAAEFGKKRKLETKAEGEITVGRNESDGKQKIIAKGTIFKTDADSSGNELRYISTEDAILQADKLETRVPVKAEFPGTIYNAAQGMIKYSVQHISGIDYIKNESDWLTKEGTDTESDDSLRARCENAWDELAANLTKGAYESIVAGVDGVLVVSVDDKHPRGQGTIDIVVTGVAGLPTEALLEAVREQVAQVKGPYDDVLVYGPEPVYQDVDVTVYINDMYGDEETVEAESQSIIHSLIMVGENNPGNKLYRAKLNYDLMNTENVVNVKVNTPAEDVSLDSKKLIMPGNIAINILREGS